MGNRKQPTPPPHPSMKLLPPPAPPASAAKSCLVCPHCGPLLNPLQQHNGICLTCRSLLTHAPSHDWKNETCDTCCFMVESDDVPFTDMFDKVQHPKMMECRFGPPQYVEGNSTYPRSWGRAAGRYPVLGFGHPACAQYQRSE